MPTNEYACDQCGSTKVSVRAWFDWDIIKQEWVRDYSSDTTWCDDCGDDLPITARPITDLKTIAQIAIAREKESTQHDNTSPTS